MNTSTTFLLENCWLSHGYSILVLYLTIHSHGTCPEPVSTASHLRSAHLGHRLFPGELVCPAFRFHLAARRTAESALGLGDLPPAEARRLPPCPAAPRLVGRGRHPGYQADLPRQLG